MVESKEGKVKTGVECCGTITQIWIVPPGPGKVNCLVCGEEHLVWV